MPFGNAQSVWAVLDCFRFEEYLTRGTYFCLVFPFWGIFLGTRFFDPLFIGVLRHTVNWSFSRYLPIPTRSFLSAYNGYSTTSVDKIGWRGDVDTSVMRFFPASGSWDTWSTRQPSADSQISPRSCNGERHIGGSKMKQIGIKQYISQGVCSVKDIKVKHLNLFIKI